MACVERQPRGHRPGTSGHDFGQRPLEKSDFSTASIRVSNYIYLDGNSVIEA